SIYRMYQRLSFYTSCRIRHTSSKRDWSSDVCSSDLAGARRSGSTLSECGPPGLRARPTYPAAGPTRPAPQEYCAPVISLDNPAWSSLSGAHRCLAEGNEHVLRYPADVSPFVGVRDWEHPEVWDAILDVFGHGAEVSVSHAEP